MKAWKPYEGTGITGHWQTITSGSKTLLQLEVSLHYGGGWVVRCLPLFFSSGHKKRWKPGLVLQKNEGGFVAEDLMLEIWVELATADVDLPDSTCVRFRTPDRLIAQPYLCTPPTEPAPKVRLPTRPKIVCDKLPSHGAVVVTTTRRRRLVSMPLIVTVMV